MPEYTRTRLLGRGACGAVWLATSPKFPDRPVAVKQVAKGVGAKYRSDERSASKEIAVGELLFGVGGGPKPPAATYPGIRHIAELLDVAETKKDLWLVMEFGGMALTKALFDIKGEFVARGPSQPRERVYRVHHLPYYQAMKRDPQVLQRLLRQILEALRVLADHEIVHSDLKPENLLLEFADGQDFHSAEARLCDFGSAFAFDRPEALTLATPEYMPPEALEICAGAGSRGFSAGADGYASLATRPWSYDIWSLGAIMLELCYGAPHWLSYKCRILGLDGRERTTTGLFAVPGRDPERILQRQQDLVADGGLERALHDAPGVPLDAMGMDMLHAMLEWNPEVRISPHEALLHPFLANAP